MGGSHRLCAALAAGLAVLAFLLGVRVGADAAGPDEPRSAVAAPQAATVLDGRWLVRRDPDGRGIAAGWPAGRFGAGP